MVENNEFCITAGEFAKLCNTTRDTLRYYDKMGILVPQKNTENGYHYYSHRQITSFYFINFFRDLDCPVRDLKEYLRDAESEEFFTFLYSQYDSLLKMKKELDTKLSVLTGSIDIINHIQQNPEGKVILEKLEKPLRIKLTPILSSPSTKFDEITSDITEHIKICNQLNGIRTFPLGGVMERHSFISKNYSYSEVFSMAEEYCNDPMIHTLPTHTIVSCVNRDSKESIESVYDRMKVYIRENKLEIKSDIYSLSLVNVVDANQEKRYLKYIFMCV